MSSTSPAPLPSSHQDLLAVPEGRRAAIASLFGHLREGMTIALSTHINADGDGCGSETALARLLRQRGIHARIVNPTPWPTLFDFLLGEDVEERSAQGARALRDVDALVVLDISDVKRLGQLTEAVRALTVPTLVIDHHIASDDPAGAVAVSDVEACATGELVFDVARTLDLEITPAIARSLYVALLTDTGGFRFSNTSPRCHAIAGTLLAAGVDPERMYQHVYASAPVGRLRLLAESLQSLEHDPAVGLSWMGIEAGSLERHGVASEDLDGIVEHARSIAGTRMALFFRDLGHGKVKISLRSTGDTDVNAFARRFGGGGHAKASGALVSGTLVDVTTRVVDDARAYLGSAPPAAPIFPG